MERLRNREINRSKLQAQLDKHADVIKECHCKLEESKKNIGLIIAEINEDLTKEYSDKIDKIVEVTFTRNGKSYNVRHAKLLSVRVYWYENGGRSIDGSADIRCKYEAMFCSPNNSHEVFYIELKDISSIKLVE